MAATAYFGRGGRYLRVVFVTTHEAGTSVGGVEQHVANLSAALVRRSVDVWVVVPHFGRLHAMQIRENQGVHVEEVTYPTRLLPVFSWLDRHAGAGWRMVFGLAAKLKYNLIGKSVAHDVMLLSPDIVHQHDFLAGLRASGIIARHIPVILTNHTSEYVLLGRIPLGRWTTMRAFRRFSFIIGPSRDRTPPLASAEYIPNGVGLTFFTPPDVNKRDAVRRYLGVSPGGVVFLCLSRWAPVKGVVYLARAIVAVAGKKSDSDCVFLFAGNGKVGYPTYHSKVQDILDHAYDANIRLLGDLSQADLRDTYHAADVTIIPSLHEATSLAALESLACGVPVLATNVGGLPEIVRDGENGWLVPPGDSVALEAKIEVLVRHPEMIEKARAQARASVENTFSWDHVADRVAEIYSQTLGRSPASMPEAKK